MTCEAGFSADQINTGMTNSVGFVPYQTSINCCVSARLDACISSARGCHCACKYSCANGGTKPFRQKCDDAFFLQRNLCRRCVGVAMQKSIRAEAHCAPGSVERIPTQPSSGAELPAWVRRQGVAIPAVLIQRTPDVPPSHTGAVAPSSRPKANRRMPGSA